MRGERRQRAPWTVLLAVALVAAALPWPAPAARAATDDTAPGSLTLVAQPAWTVLGGKVPLQLRIRGAGTGLAVRVEVHDRLSSRLGFEDTVRGQHLGGLLDEVDVPVDALARSGDVLDLTLLLQPLDAPYDPGLLQVVTTGVYPTSVSLVDPTAGTTLDHFVTWLVAVRHAPVDAPLRFAWIWRVAAPPTYLPDGSPDPAVVTQLRPDGRVGALAQALGSADGVPLTLSVGPETLQSWSALARHAPSLASGIAAVRAAGRPGSGNEVLASPYVPLDLPALEAGGLGDQISTELLAGSDTLRQQLGTIVDPRTSASRPLDDAALDRLHGAFVARLVVPDTALTPSTAPLTPARPFVLESGGHDFEAVETNSGLDSMLAGTAPPALRAQRFLADLALVALEAPSVDRGIVVETGAGHRPDPAVLRLVLAGLRDHPLLTPTTVDSLFAAVPNDHDANGDTLVRHLLPVRPARAPVRPSALATAQSELDSFRPLVGADDPRIARGRRAILSSLAAAYETPKGRSVAAGQLASIDAMIQRFASGITTSAKTITLTARKAEIPLSFRNETGHPVEVLVRLQSSKLIFPSGPQHLVRLAPGNTTRRFEVEARVSGTFPMLVGMYSSDGKLEIGAPTRITVRSTVFGGIGWFLTIGALVFLAAWWANHFRRSRRQRRATTTPEGS